jgi:hypothetical protein
LQSGIAQLPVLGYLLMNSAIETLSKFFMIWTSFRLGPEYI